MNYRPYNSTLTRRTPLKRSALPRISRRQRERLRLFYRLVPIPEGQLCQWPGGCPHLATERHHRRGKEGPLLFDTRHILLLCWEHHRCCTGTYGERTEAVRLGAVGSRHWGRS